MLKLEARLRDAESYWEFESGPSQSCDYQAYFCRSAASTAESGVKWNEVRL